MFFRRIWFMVLTAALVLGAAVVWVLPGESEFEVTHHDMRGAPQAPAFRVVQLSGDAIDRADALPVLQSFLQALGGLSVVAVPGNWEHWSGVDVKALATVLAD